MKTKQWIEELAQKQLDAIHHEFIYGNISFVPETLWKKLEKINQSLLDKQKQETIEIERERVSKSMKSIHVHGNIILDSINFGSDEEQSRSKMLYHFKKIQDYLNNLRWGDDYLKQKVKEL